MATGPLEGAAVAARRELQIGSAWGPSTELDVTLGAVGRTGIAVTFSIVGAVPRACAEDLRWALVGVREDRARAADCGSTYTANAFTRLCRRLGIRQSMGRVGSCFRQCRHRGVLL